jgi:hypothetical protein
MGWMFVKVECFHAVSFCCVEWPNEKAHLPLWSASGIAVRWSALLARAEIILNQAFF